MPIIDGIFCSVHTPEGPLKEFPCGDGSSPNSASAYIVARDGQHFSIKCSAPSPYKHMPVASTDALIIQLRIDGVDEKPPALLDHLDATIMIKGTKIQTTTGDWELRKFMFSSVELIEERGRGELELESINKLGEIVVKVERFRKSGMTRASQGGNDTGTERAVIHEKTIKGRDVSHSVRRAKGEYCPPQTLTMGTYLDSAEHPLMTFRFLYKSERALKNMGLIERSPSPPRNLLIERNPSPARSRPLKIENSKPKRGRDDSAGPSGRSKIPRRQEMNLGDIEIIDLTGDD